jgi:epoxyqueuosine reductase
MNQSAKLKEQLRTDPAKFIKREIYEFVRTSPARRLSFLNDFVMWDKPLVKFADGDDHIFIEYKSVIALTHLTPREALAKHYNKSANDLPERLSVISWILPIVEETCKSNRTEMRIPSRLWSHTRWYGEKFNDALRKHVADVLIDAGYLATAPMSQPYFEEYCNEKGPYSNWSERHVAYAAGQGTFCLSDGLITERGVAHRCGSVVTDLVLPASRRKAKNPYSNCLFYRGIDCKICTTRCPVGAITEKGHDKIKCQHYLHDIKYGVDKEGAYDNDKSVIGCGFCQTKVPCEHENPTKKLKKVTA